jgi:transposase InsO family protein
VESGLTLNKNKFEFSKNQIDYLGQVIDGEGLKPDPKKVKAILEMKDPESVADVRRFLGMVNQQMKFLPDLAEKTKPLRDLLLKDKDWVWGDAQQAAFALLKKDLTSADTLAFYSPGRETVVTADSSSYGLGAVLLQRQDNGRLKAVAYASRSLTATERRYAQIEKEALAITWSLEHWADLLTGMHFQVETDHKPLVPLFSTKLIDELPIRVQRFRMRLMRYSFSIRHVPGKDLHTADALSRAPPVSSNQPDGELTELTEVYVNSVLQTIPASDRRLQEIRTELQKDVTLKTVMHYVMNGWPDKQQLSKAEKAYWSEAGSLSVHDGLLMRGRRLVVPPSVRADVLRYLHDGHQGVVKTKEHAAYSVWWPGLTKEVEAMVRTCPECNKTRRARVEPMIGTPFPERPWQRVGADFFEYKNNTYLIAVDYYSRDVEIVLMSKRVTAAETITKCKKVFSRHGIPDVLMTDNGPQFFAREFAEFATKWGFVHVTSSPGYPQSNGEVERAVQTIKALMKKCEDDYLGLLMYRNSPLENGYSPAQLSMGRRLKTRVPCPPSSLIPQTPDASALRKKEQHYRERMKKTYDRRHRVVQPESIVPGNVVWIPDLEKTGTVVREHEAPRSLIIETGESTILELQPT